MRNMKNIYKFALVCLLCIGIITALVVIIQKINT